MQPTKWEKRLSFVRRVEAGRRSELPTGSLEPRVGPCGHLLPPPEAGRPPKPAEMCDACIAEQMARRNPKRDSYEASSYEPPVSDRVDLALARYQERLKAEGHVIAGSDAEADVLDRIRDLRAEEAEREAAKHRGFTPRGILVSQRPENGFLVEYRAFRPRGGHGRSQIVRRVVG